MTKKLAIISSFDESCGNAAFTKVIRDSILAYTEFQAEVIGLNLPLLQSSLLQERKLADLHIEKICTRLKDFDAVNIQFEPSLFGTLPNDIINRVTRLIHAHPKISVTLHSPRIISQQQHNFRLAVKALLNFEFKKGISMLTTSLTPSIKQRINKKILRLLTKSNIRLIVHTSRAKHQIRNIYNYQNVDVHPLKIVDPSKKFNSETLDNIKKGLKIEKQAIIIGVFGYILPYKGHTDAIKAMSFLPQEYKLMIFGRQHPQTIRPQQVDQYLELLINIIQSSDDLKNRVFFLGELNDEELINAAANVDIALLPYYENGQDGSGIASICYDVSKMVLASSSFAFDELLKLIPYKNTWRFDIGNYLEIATKAKLAGNNNFWILQSIGWTGYWVLRTISGFAAGIGWMLLVHTLLLTATGYSLTLLMGSLFRRVIKMRPIWTLVISLTAVIVASGAFSIIETWSVATFLKPDMRPTGIAYLTALSLDFILLAAWSALYYGINYFLLLEEQIDQREKLESQASSAQLAMLRYQLNPHFLFNTLNSISTLVLLKQTERANAMLARLSSFLRYTLVNEPAGKVTLAQEVETLKLYLEIEKMRFEDRLRPHFRIEPDTIGARLPSLLLQPLIENAIKYAVTPSENGADIWITASHEGHAVRIEVADNGNGEDAEIAASPSTGVGLANIRDRLSQAYGAAHRFDTRKNDKGGFSVIIEIPYETGETA